MVLEIGRKLRAPEQEEPGVNTYTADWETHRALGAWLLAGAVAAAVTLLSSPDRQNSPLVRTNVGAGAFGSLRGVCRAGSLVTSGEVAVTTTVQAEKYITAGGAARHPCFGGKMRALADLVNANLGGASIPAWFALTPEAFRASVQPSGVNGQVHIQMSQALKTELAQAVRQLCPDSALLAVRSSRCRRVLRQVASAAP